MKPAAARPSKDQLARAPAHRRACTERPSSKEETMWRPVVICAALIVAASAPRQALAEAGNTCGVLARIDQSYLQYDDQEYQTTINYRENKQLVKTFKIRVVTKGSYKTLVSFSAPGEMRGTRVLIVDAETMYTYLPEYGRIRRVAGHSRRQSFMGTNMYYEDITDRRYSTRWRCTPVKTSADSWVLDLTIAPGNTSAYTKLQVTVNRQHEDVERIDYYEETRHMKTQERSVWKVMNGIGRYSIIRFVSRDRDADLELEYDSWQVNTGISDDAFTQRALLRGF
jgi:outer membrane lipoprotein-sorting protein